MKPVPQAHVLPTNNHSEECEHILGQLFHDQTGNDGKQWYRTLQTCDDPSKLNKIERQMFDEIITLRGKEKLNLTKTDEQREHLCQSSTAMIPYSMRKRKTERSTS